MKKQLTTKDGKRLFAEFVDESIIYICSEPDFHNRENLDDRGDVFSLRGTEYRLLRCWVKVQRFGDEGQHLSFELKDESGIYLTRTDNSYKDPAPTHKLLAGGKMMEAVNDWAKGSKDEFMSHWEAFAAKETNHCLEMAEKTLAELEAASAAIKRGVQTLTEANSLDEQRAALVECGTFLKFGVRVKVSDERGAI